MAFDPTITFGNIIEICTIAGGGMIALGAMRTKIANLDQKVGNLKDNIAEMKQEIRAIGDMTVNMAVTNQRVMNVEQDVRELKHGRGFVQDELRGEWPRT